MNAKHTSQNDDKTGDALKAQRFQMLEDIAKAGAISAIALRYFNPIGADPKLRTGPQSANP